MTEGVLHGLLQRCCAEHADAWEQFAAWVKARGRMVLGVFERLKWVDREDIIADALKNLMAAVRDSKGTEPTAAHHAAAAIAELDRSTWLAGVGQPLPLGFPERFANACMVASWGEAKPRSPNPPRSCSGAPRWRVSGWLAGDGADRTSGRNTKGQPQEGGSSPSGYFRAGAAIAAIRPSPLNSESYLAREVFVPLILRGEGLPGHGELAEVEFS